MRETTIAAEARTFSHTPISYALEEIVPAEGISIAAAWNVLQIRREVLERVCGIEELSATKKRHQAQAESCEYRLQNENLADYDRKSVEGLKEECEARSRKCARQKEQYEMELQVLYRQLIGDES